MTNLANKAAASNTSETNILKTFQYVDNAKYNCEKLEGLMNMFMFFCSDASMYSSNYIHVNNVICEIMDLSSNISRFVKDAHSELGGDDE